MSQPLWMLVPWAVFAVAVGLKLWRLTGLLRRQAWGHTSGTERFRQSLERIWAKDQQPH
jgi:hypothetical protein